MIEAHQSVHERKLPRIIELETGNAFSRGGDCRLRQLSAQRAESPWLLNGVGVGVLHHFEAERRAYLLDAAVNLHEERG